MLSRTIQLKALARCTLNHKNIRALTTSNAHHNNVNVTVDGVTISVPANSTVMQACELAGVNIPRFCYHDRLAVAGNCRMCLVEITTPKMPKPQASCAIPVMKDMVVNTKGSVTKKAREGVMEFLLANHPLDCPICDQGGECDLQDQSMVYGSDRSRYTEIHHSNKRATEDKQLGPLIKTSMNRCIHCTRCIRFASEVAGVDELGTTGRGNSTNVGTYVNKMFLSELSGNLVDLCPVGALTSQPYAFTARPWELRRTESIDVHDALGSNIRVDSRAGEIMRIQPRLHEGINEEWLSDKSRYSYDGLKRQRITSPMVKSGGKFKKVDWEDALIAAAKALNEARSSVTVIAGSVADAESMVLLKDLVNTQDSENVFTEATFSQVGGGSDLRSNYIMNAGLEGIDKSDAVLIVGTNTRYEAPVFNSRIRRCHMHNALKVGVIGDIQNLNFEHDKLGSNASALSEIATGKSKWASILKNANNPMIIVGSAALESPESASILALARKIASTCKNGLDAFNVLHKTAAAVGALDVGYKSNTLKDYSGTKVLYLLEADDNIPEREMLPSGCIVIYQGSHGDKGAHMADIVLPASAYTEKYGTYVNTEGRAQQTQRVVTAPGLGREGWQIIRALSEVKGDKLPYDTLMEVRDRVADVAPGLYYSHYDKVEASAFKNLAVKALNGVSLGSPTGPLKPKIQHLSEFFVTNAITRNSQIMARCVKAVHTKESIEGPGACAANW